LQRDVTIDEAGDRLRRGAYSGRTECRTTAFASQGKERIIAENLRAQDNQEQIDRLIREIEEAELFAQRLRTYIVAIRDDVAGGHTGRALSICNQALTEIDSATDVVAPSPQRNEHAGLDVEDEPHRGNAD